MSAFQRRIEKTIDEQFQFFKQQNDYKHTKYIVSIWNTYDCPNVSTLCCKYHRTDFVDLFQVKVNSHNEKLKIRINDTLLRGIMEEIDKFDVDSSEMGLERAFMTLKKAALQKVFHSFIFYHNTRGMSIVHSA